MSSASRRSSRTSKKSVRSQSSRGKKR
jgi:hypothetical protein